MVVKCKAHYTCFSTLFYRVERQTLNIRVYRLIVSNRLVPNKEPMISLILASLPPKVTHYYSLFLDSLIHSDMPTVTTVLIHCCSLPSRRPSIRLVPNAHTTFVPL